jgi:phosphoribosylaminoimidazole-succinocarboxamide synthase
VLYEGPEPGTLVQHFKDDATAFNAEKHEVIEGKGVLNNRISEYIFLQLAQIGIQTHFIKALNMREQLIREAEIVPLEVVIRNVAAGSLVKRLGLKEGQQLPRPLIEFYYKDDALGDPLISEDHIAVFADKRLPHRPVCRCGHSFGRFQAGIWPRLGGRHAADYSGR